MSLYDARVYYTRPCVGIQRVRKEHGTQFSPSDREWELQKKKKTDRNVYIYMIYSYITYRTVCVCIHLYSGFVCTHAYILLSALSYPLPHFPCLHRRRCSSFIIRISVNSSIRLHNTCISIVVCVCK